MTVFTLVATMQYETVQKLTFLPERQESRFAGCSKTELRLTTPLIGAKVRAISSEKSAKLTLRSVRSDSAVAPSQGSKPYTSNSDAVPT
jgi:hypothetical protein